MEEKVSGIYKIINKINGKYYVGSSRDIYGKRGRWYKHKIELTKNRHYNPHLQRAWNKYGENHFELQVIEIVSENLLLEKEQEYLDEAKNEKDVCYNNRFIAKGGGLDLEIREKIRKQTPKLK